MGTLFLKGFNKNKLKLFIGFIEFAYLTTNKFLIRCANTMKLHQI